MSRSLLRPLIRVLPLLPIALLATGCDEAETPTGPDAPAPTAVTETFTGAISRNGATAFVFVANTGSISASLTSVAPADAVIGFAIGEWNATTELCQLRLTKDAARQGDVIIGAAQLTGNYCLRVYDASGNLTAPVTFEAAIVHF